MWPIRHAARRSALSSCSISFSNVRSATIYFSRVFSCSSSGSRFIPDGIRPEYFLFQLKQVAWLVPHLPTELRHHRPILTLIDDVRVLRVRELLCLHRFRISSSQEWRGKH